MPDAAATADRDGRAPRDVVLDLVVDTLQAAGLEASQVGERRIMTMLSGEWKRTIPLLLEVDERMVTATSLFSGVPDEGHEAVYRLLLQRNQRAGYVHFALDDEGDLVLTGKVPLAAVDADLLEALLGEVLTLADSTFNRVLRTGFASYLDHEQQWRAGAGMPANPVGDAIHAQEPRPDGD